MHRGKIPFHSSIAAHFFFVIKTIFHSVLVVLWSGVAMPCTRSPSTLCHSYTKYTNTISQTSPALLRPNSDRHRDASAPIVGSSGSTALHFAAANGHSNVVRTLLLHGAHADRADKYGVTPEMLARENGKEGMAEVLKEWLANKDRDLREAGEIIGGRAHVDGGGLMHHTQNPW